MKSKIPGYYDATEAAQVLRCRYSTVTRYVRVGLLPAIHLGRRIIIEQAAVHDFVPPQSANPKSRRNGKANGSKT